MNNNGNGFLYNDLTEKIIGCAYRVYNELGSGFLEKIYENALKIELEEEGLRVSQQEKIDVHYKGILIGDYIADLLVEDKIIIELKAVNELATVHENQLVNYLKATGMKLGLLINFGNKLKIKRKILTPNKK
jgi:GxxExxY protein